MTKRFDYFVMFAEMRTGSNFLEANINEFEGLTCYGEAYNPHFVGYPKKTDLLGITQAMRESDPMSLISKMRTQTKGLPGFRFFRDHDARMLEQCLQDRRCAKIILTRNLLDSYVSWKIAKQTNQWKLTNAKKRRTVKIRFNMAEFEMHLAGIQTFQKRLQTALQSAGQTAFYLSYEDIPNVDVLNGLAMFLEVDDRIKHVSKALKRQNPTSLKDKVENYDEMVAALREADLFYLITASNTEPRRGPVVPSYVAAAEAPLMYLPIKCGPEVQIRNWLAAFGGDDEDSLLTGFNQKTLRQWKRKHKGHRSFTVICHPVVRAHAAFCECILDIGEGSYPEIRETLRLVYKLPIPSGEVDGTYDLHSHREAFLVFLKFLKENLRGQTSIRIDPAWCSQSRAIEGFRQFASPDMVLREDKLVDGLAYLASEVGMDVPVMPTIVDTYPIALSEIYDSEIEAACRDAYQRDYMMFGYKALSQMDF